MTLDWNVEIYITLHHAYVCDHFRGWKHECECPPWTQDSDDLEAKITGKCELHNLETGNLSQVNLQEEHCS